jgi:fructose-1,6-bisphosphatase II
MASDISVSACLCQAYASVTEEVAMVAGRWLGRGDEQGARAAAAETMFGALDTLPIDARVVIGGSGGGDPDGPPPRLGRGGESVHLAVDALEGGEVVARGGTGAMAMIAAGEPDTVPALPDMYMRKIAVGPRARGRIDLRAPIAENVVAVADAFGRKPNDITAIVLDRQRHHDLLEELRASGARIKLILDGDVTSTISAAIRGTNDHISVGIGGSRQAIIASAALLCLGGELQAQLWPTTRSEIETAAEMGITDIERVLTTEELAPSRAVVAATGISNGDLLRGVRYLGDNARTHSVVMCSRCNRVRFVDGIHFYDRERREEVRLLA